MDRVDSIMVLGEFLFSEFTMGVKHTEGFGVGHIWGQLSFFSDHQLCNLEYLENSVPQFLICKVGIFSQE